MTVLFTLAFVSLTVQDKSKEWPCPLKPFEEAKERAKTTPPKVRERSHTASPANIEGKLDQLLADVESWPDGPPNWSEKARMYNIKTKGSASTTGNGGQLVKAFLQ